MAEGKFGTKCTQDDLRPAFLFRSLWTLPLLPYGGWRGRETCARIGDKGCAFKWLEKGFEECDDLNPRHLGLCPIILNK